jgi:hypothetical protein
MSVPCEWTDLEPPSLLPPEGTGCILDYETLIRLRQHLDDYIKSVDIFFKKELD